MHFTTQSGHPWPRDPETALPAQLDIETLVLLRTFLTPILETARSWHDLRAKLLSKGYDLAFRHGRLVILNSANGMAVVTGKSLGTPLRTIAARIGRPRLQMHASGQAARLAPAN